MYMEASITSLCSSVKQVITCTWRPLLPPFVRRLNRSLHVHGGLAASRSPQQKGLPAVPHHRLELPFLLRHLLVQHVRQYHGHSDTEDGRPEPAQFRYRLAPVRRPGQRLAPGQRHHPHGTGREGAHHSFNDPALIKERIDTDFSMEAK